MKEINFVIIIEFLAILLEMNGVVLAHNKIVHWSFKKSVDKVNMFFDFLRKRARLRGRLRTYGRTERDET